MKPKRKRTTPVNRRRCLRFSPTAWAKLLYLRDYGDTEVGGFGIAEADNLLTIGDVQLIKQDCTPVTVAFDDESVADFFDRQVDRELVPEQFARVWVHTHPGNSAHPSLTDEETFARVFGRSDWAVMFILAQEGQTYARVHFNVGPGGEMELSVGVDFGKPFPGSEHAAWEAEYLENVADETCPIEQPRFSRNLLDPAGTLDEWDEETEIFRPRDATVLAADKTELPLGELFDDDMDGCDLWDQYLNNEQSEDFP